MQPEIEWVAFPEEVPLRGDGVAQWGDLLARDPWLVRATISCESRQLVDQLVKRLQCIQEAVRILAFECRALVPTNASPSIHRALQLAGIPCEKVASSSLVLVVKDRFGRHFEGPQLRVVPGRIEEQVSCQWADLVGLLVEQGELPFWLAPTQGWILPVADADLEMANDYQQQAKQAGLRVVVRPPSQPLGQRIADAVALEIPDLLVVGERERDTGTVSLRQKEGRQSPMPFAQWLKSKV
jgi:nucleotide-binding universal stress UspA family protein